MLTLALPKGRILKQAITLLEKTGIEIDNLSANNRKLLHPTNLDNLNVSIVRASDIPTFVQYHAIDLGIVGKDSLIEAQYQGLYELMDLNIAPCRLVLAAKSKADVNTQPLKIATKYMRAAQHFFMRKELPVELIKLSGALEIVPGLNLANGIVDLVETGNTLKANNLIEVETIANITTRLVVNTATFKTRNEEVKALLAQIERAL